MISAGGAFATSSLEGPGESNKSLSHFIGAGIRVSDLIGVGVERRRWFGEANDRRNFDLINVDFFPYYRSGLPGFRLSAGVGRADIEGHPYAGGHAWSEVKGKTGAASVGVSYDSRAGYLSVSPYVNHSASRGGGLQRRYCSTPNYLSGDFTQVCSEGTAKSVSVTSIGLSVGIR